MFPSWPSEEDSHVFRVIFKEKGSFFLMKTCIAFQTVFLKK